MSLAGIWEETPPARQQAGTMHDALPARCHAIRAGGVKIHWTESGPPSASPPVVLLHGLNDSHLTWKAVAADLAQDRRVIMPDLPGHGLSERPDATYALTWYAAVMAAWLAALGLEEVDLVGHSFGGGVAQMLLLECRQRIRRLVLVSSGGLGRKITFALRLASIPWVIEHLGQPFMALGTKLAMRCVNDGRTQKDIATLSAMNAGSGSARAFARTIDDIIDWRGQRRTYDQRVHEIGELPPILVIWGDEDSIIPVSQARAFSDSLLNVQLMVLKRCGHHPHYEYPQLVTDALRRYLASPTAPAAMLR